MKWTIHSIIFLFLFIFSRAEAQDIQKWTLTDLKSAVKNADKPTVINFWATFCLPCLDEVPYFQQLVKKYESAGVKLIFVSVDPSENFPKKIQTFTVQHNFRYPVKFLDETDAKKYCPVVNKNWSGALPATLFINHKTSYYHFFEEQLTAVQLEKEIKLMIHKQ